MLKKHLKFIANLSINQAGKILIGFMILTLMLGYQTSFLKMHVSFDYLLPDNNPRIQTFNQILDEFENGTSIFLLAAGSEDSLRSFAYRIKPLLESFDEWVSSVHTQTQIEYLRKNILKLMKPNELDNFGEIFYDPNLIPFLSNLNNSFENTYLHSKNEIITSNEKQNAVDFLERLILFIKVQKDIMQEMDVLDVGQKAVDAIVFGEGLRLSQHRDMLLIIIEPSFNMHLSPEILMMNVNGIEEIISETGIQHGIKTGLAGPLVKARDHYTTLLSGLWKISLLTIVGFFFTLILFFSNVRIPFICFSTLMSVFLWTLGTYSLCAKDITVASIPGLIFIFILGIGNCILFMSEFSGKQSQGLNTDIAIKETLQRFGSGVILGGGVIGLSFFVVIFSEIKVFQDLGVLVGIGIIANIMATMLLLPSIMILLEKFHGNIIGPLHPSKAITYQYMEKVVQLIVNYRWISIIFILLITVFIFFQGIKMDIYSNISNLNSYNIGNTHIEDELVKSFGISSSLISVTTNNLEAARVVTDQSRGIKSSGWVESISDYLPDEAFNSMKFRYISELRRKIKSREVRKQLSSYDMNIYRKEFERLEANIIELQNISLLKNQITVYNQTIKLVGDGTGSSEQGILSTFINAMDSGINRLKLTYFQEQFSSAFKSTVLEMANTEPLTLQNLPIEIKSRFTGGNDNLFRINIYPNQNIWRDTIFLDHFVNKLSSLNEKITGWPVLFVEFKDRMSYFGFKSIYFMLFCMFFLLLIVLRSIKNILIVLASITSGFIWFMGILMLLNIPLNLINIWIIPVILSIGMYNTIQILQRWQNEKNLVTIYRSTVKTIFLTTITIFVMAFPFWFTNHIWLISIAILLPVGLVCSFLTHLLIILPFFHGDTPQ